MPKTGDDTEEDDTTNGSTAMITTKPKKGKATLPLKRDKVGYLQFLFFSSFLLLIYSFILKIASK